MQIENIRRIGRLLRQSGNTRISRQGMPNGFFFHDLLWFGDANSNLTAVARGFIIEPSELDTMDEGSLEDLSDRLRVLLRSLGNEYQMQVRYTVGSDYSDVLDAYRYATLEIKDPFRHRWQVWNRTERHARYVQAMEDGKLRRETLVVFFTRVIESYPGFSLSEDYLASHFESLAIRESLSFDQIQGDALNTYFPDCRVRSMTDRDHYLHYYKFLNPSSECIDEKWAFSVYDDSLSIQENCLFTDIAQPHKAGISFQLDGYNNVMIVMRELPKQIGPGMISRLTSLGFQDFEITVNLYPQEARTVVKEFESVANQLKGEVRTKHKEEYSLGEELEQGAKRIKELHSGKVKPFDVFFALRLWHRDADTVISRASIAKNAFGSMAGAICHHANLGETSAQLWFNTWPGWTYSTYRGYDLKTDDQTAAELLPWSSSFTGRLEKAEALYDSPSGGLVGLRTEIGGTSQHMLVFGQTGAGKSILLTDLMAQTLHNFDYVLIVEEGRDHETTVRTAGGQPVVVRPNSDLTINYLDTGGMLTPQHVGNTVAMCLQMLREKDGSNVSAIQGILTKHINLLYETAWEEWASKNREEAHRIEKLAYRTYLDIARMEQGATFFDAWEEFQDEGFYPTPPDDVVADFVMDHRTRHFARDLSYFFMKATDMPTHAELVELLTITPIGGHEDNPEAVKIGDRLAAWCADGPYGKIFDGYTTVRLDGDVTHFELGSIPDSMRELRAAAHYLVLNVSRQQVMRRPRAQRKLVLFEEGARLISMPGGADALKEYYTQMRKYGAVVCTAFQQVAALQAADQTVRASVIDNTKLFLISAQPSLGAAEDIADVLELSDASRQIIKRYPLPEHQKEKFSSFMMVAPDPRRKIVGTFRNYATPEVIYCGASDNKVFDDKAKKLLEYEDVVEGILNETKIRNAEQKDTL